MQVFDVQALVMPPNVAPVEGHAQLRLFADAYPRISAFQITAAEIDGRGDLAYDRGRFDLTAGGVSESGSYRDLEETDRRLVEDLSRHLALRSRSGT